MRRADQLIPLADELQLAQQYLDMEKRRLGERLEVDWRVDELPPGAAVLPFILQPCWRMPSVTACRRGPKAGRVSVYGRSEGDRVVITIGNPVAGGDDGLRAVTAWRCATSGSGLHWPSVAGRRLQTNRDKDRFYAVLSVPHVKHIDR